MAQDLPEAVAKAARKGNVDAVREWLAAGGAPDAIYPNGNTLLNYASMSSRPSCASVVEILCAAGARDVGGLHGDGSSLAFAALFGAVESVRVLLRCGSPANAMVDGTTTTALHYTVIANNWRYYNDPWSRASAQAAVSTGSQGIVRLLLKHGATVDARGTDGITPLMLAGEYSGFVSPGVVRELLAGGADLKLVDNDGQDAEAIARDQLQKDIYTGEGIPEDPRTCRRPGAVEAFLDLCAAVRAAGSWKRYANAPRIDVIVLQRLCAAGRASPPPALARLFPTSTKSPPLPKEMVWLILKFWRTDRDP